MTLIILSILAVLLLFFLLSSIRLKFQYDNQKKYLKLSFLFFAITVYPSQKKTLLSLAGYSVKEFRPKIQKALPTSSRTQRVAEATKEKEKPKVSTDWRSLWDTIHRDELRRIPSLLKKIKVKYLNFDISGGMYNPCQTGIAYGTFMALKGMLPKIMRHVTFRPDFCTSRLKFEGKGLVYLRIYHILITVFKILGYKVLTHWRKKIMPRKKGAVYAQ